MTFVPYFLEKANFIILLMDMATGSSNRAFETPNNMLEAANLGQKNLGKIYTRLPKTQGT